MEHDHPEHEPVSRQARHLKHTLEAARHGREALGPASLAELADRLEALCRSVERLERAHAAGPGGEAQPVESAEPGGPGGAEPEDGLAEPEDGVVEDCARLASIVEGSEDPIIIKTLDGVVTSWNRSAERLYGYPAERMIGRSIATIVPGDRRGELEQILAQLRAGRHIPPFETIRLRRDGRRVDVSITIAPVRDRSGRVVGASAIQRDITLRKQNETALARAHLALKRKNEEMRQFLSIIAHDLKHPAVGIDWMLGMLERKAVDRLEPRDRYNLELAIQECGRMQRMLEQLEHLARIAHSEPRPERTDLGRLVHGCAERFRRMAGEIGVELRVEAPSVELKLSRAYVEQMVMNLLDNALKYGCGEDGGRVELEARCEPGECRISVTDHGPGIPPRYRELVFHPFRRVNGGGERPGSGLGLPAVRRLAEAIDGRVELDSEVGRGTRFTIRFPRHEPVAESA